MISDKYKQNKRPAVNVEEDQQWKMEEDQRTWKK